MAEFAEVMRERNRMCKTFKNCSGGCAFVGILEELGFSDCRLVASERPEVFEETIMKWSAEHPKKTYATAIQTALPQADMEMLQENTCPGWFVKGWPISLSDCVRNEDGDQDCQKCWNQPVPGE